MKTTMTTVNFRLNIPQSKFLQLPHKFKAYVAGFGSGKTFVGCAGICAHFWQWPGIDQGYFAPTYPQIRDIFYPTMEEVSARMGLRIKVKQANHEVEVYEGRKHRGTVKCRSMEDPSTIVGFKIGHALVDELDVMPMKKARDAWRKIIARMRYKVPGLLNGIDVTTTPEGFKFVYEQFVKAVRDKPNLARRYGLIQASTYDNEANLPRDYIPSLRESYPPALIEAYLRGQFVNLTAGRVYPEFCRTRNFCNTVVLLGEDVHVGLDFNVGKMAAVVHVLRDGMPHAAAELVDVRDTPAMAEELRDKYLLMGHKVVVYPDASGANTSSKGASLSDIGILKDAGLEVRARDANPRVKDRVNAMNAMILNDWGQRRYKVNPDTCPTYTECLEQQAYDKFGAPDKDAGFDHATDAGGYFISFCWPLDKTQWAF